MTRNVRRRRQDRPAPRLRLEKNPDNILVKQGICAKARCRIRLTFLTDRTGNAQVDVNGYFLGRTCTVTCGRVNSVGCPR
jgi:hypothetical protein